MHSRQVFILAATVMTGCATDPGHMVEVAQQDIERGAAVPVHASTEWNASPLDIFIGDTLHFSCDPFRSTRPWPGHGGFFCAGDSDNYWKHSTDPCCEFGSLIGRIGASGATFCIAGPACVPGAPGCPEECTQPRAAIDGVYTAEEQGTLYLGFNDGGNFRDNHGSWLTTVIVDSQTCSFELDRLALARTAYRLASHNPYQQTDAAEYDLSFHVGDADGGQPGPYSAMFMSLAYLGGGLPMLASGDPLKGWWARLASGTVHGQISVWNNHNYSDPVQVGDLPALPPDGDLVEFAPSDVGGGRLIGYLTGETDGDALPAAGVRDFAVSRSALLVPRNQVYQGDALDLDRLYAVQARIAGTARRGDYLYIDSSGETHGFVVMGFAPPVSCETDVLESVIVEGETLDIDLQRVDPSDVHTHDFTVPWVVDWTNYDRAYRRPRPFYCSYHDYTELSGRIFAQTYWLFVPAPDRSTYQCSATYTPDPEEVIPIGNLPSLWPHPADTGSLGGQVLLAGSPLATAVVTVCPSAAAGPHACRRAETSAAGAYEFSLLPAGSYTVIAYPPGGQGTPTWLYGVPIVADQAQQLDLLLDGPLLLPPGTTISNDGITASGVPFFHPSTVVTLTTEGCPDGTASFRLRQESSVLASGFMAEDPAGAYAATFGPFQDTGAALVEIAIDCPGEPDVHVAFHVDIDPGVVGDVAGTP